MEGVDVVFGNDFLANADLHHLFASRCECVLIMRIRLRRIIPFLYRIIPKIGRHT